MNLQTEISRHEVAGILLGMEKKNQYVRSYSGLVRFGLDLIKALYGYEELSLEDAERYLSTYSGAGTGLSLAQNRRMELARERREERMPEQAFSPLPIGTIAKEVLSIPRSMFEAAMERGLAARPTVDTEEDEEGEDPNLLEMQRAAAAAEAEEAEAKEEQ